MLLVYICIPSKHIMKFSQPDCAHCNGRRDSLFSFCKMAEIDELNESKSCNSYKRGQVVFEEGANPLGVYCINSGKVKLYKHASDGKEQIIRIVKPGDFLGYRSMLAGTKYKLSASAMEDTAVCMIPKATFLELFRTNESFSKGLLSALCSTLDESYTKMADIAYKPVRGRVAEALLFLHNFYKDEQNPHGIINIGREDLASFVGTVKETAIRMLKEFKDEGLIETDKSNIIIKDSEGLLHISELYD